jgi:hypothetical protein
MYEVKDGARTLRFEGTLLGTSSSWRNGSQRWIEFSLYKTSGEGKYILARTGVSLVFHRIICPLVGRYGLQEVEVDKLLPQAVPCEECNPDYEEPFLFPEKFRYWTLVSDEPDAVLDALYQRDESGGRYLTKVAERLLERAADLDPEIDAIYRIEFIA